MKKLNDEQLQAINHTQGPLLIIAGAGTGKTTVITERISHLIQNVGIKSHEILALTFTEKAAREMEERVDIALPYGYTQLWISTFHGFCDRILRNEAVQIGLTPGYRLMSQAESVKFFRDRLFRIDLDYFRPLGNPTKFVHGMLTHFSRLKDEDITPEHYRDWLKTVRKTSEADEQEIVKWQELSAAYTAYETSKAQEGVMDFSDLISNTLLLFRKRPNILRQYQEQFKHILVDEFQDTNIAQYELIKLLSPSSERPNLVVVGDDSQSIYKFRGAAISNILSFMKEYPDAQQIVLNNNYRSTQTILDQSHRLIKHNDPDTLEAQMGISKKLAKVRSLPEHNVTGIFVDRMEDEAEEIVREITALKTDNSSSYDWKDFAILVRANNHADPFIRAFKRQGIPFQFLGPGMLFRQEEVKDLIAYLKVLNNFEDSPSFYRLITMRQFAVSARDIAALANYAKKHNISLFVAAERMIAEHAVESSQVSLDFAASSSYEKLGEIVSMIHRHMERIHQDTAGQILYYFLEDTKMIEQFAQIESAEEEKQLQNISKFFDKIRSYEMDHEDASISAVVDWIDLAMELGESPLAADTDWVENDAVTILTVHSSKGLEFPVVFLPHLITGRFPPYERREQIPIPDDLIKESLPSGDHHIQEERRLFYVGMTRARDRLYMSAAKFYGEGKRERKVSPFVFEAGIEPDTVSSKKTKQPSLLEYGTQETPVISPEKKIIKPITYLSYSQIETFLFCPMHYKAKYLLKLPMPTYAAASYGTTLHQVMRKLYEALMKGTTMTKKEIVSYYEDIWESTGFQDAKQEKLMRALGKRQITAFYDEHFDAERVPTLVEKPFIFPVKPNLKFGGVIDRLDVLPKGGIEIIDYKTSSKIPTQKDVDKNLQLTLYALAATEVAEIGRGVDPENITLSLFFFKENIKLSTKRTRKQLAEAQEKVIKIAEEIQSSQFKCSGNMWCNNCEFKMLCG